MISGASVMIFSHDAEADREFFRDVLKIGAVDAGGGWLIFGLPPTELGFHPAEAGAPTPTELFLMCDDVHKLLAEMGEAGVAAEAIADQGWGLASRITLPSGARLGIYQPRHPRPTAG
jgi:catechol 2,3-dioxygenase-like lactoylglutathione lyase family enzyme